MAQTNGPFLPKRGWMKRWTIQGAQVLSRSPEAILLILATVLVIGYLNRTVPGAIQGLTGLRIAGLTLANIIVIPLGMAGMLLAMNALRKADRGESVGAQELLLAGLPAILSVTRFVTLLGMVLMALILPLELLVAPNTDPEAQSAAGGMLGSVLIHGAGEVSSAMVMGIVLHPFTVVAVVLRGMSSEMLRANAAMIRMRDPGLYLTLMLSVFVGHLMVHLLPAMIQIPFLALYVAWIYAGGREVVDGDDQNGQVETARKSVMSAG